MDDGGRERLLRAAQMISALLLLIVLFAVLYAETASLLVTLGVVVPATIVGARLILIGPVEETGDAGGDER